MFINNGRTDLRSGMQRNTLRCPPPFPQEKGTINQTVKAMKTPDEKNTKRVYLLEKILNKGLAYFNKALSV